MKCMIKNFLYNDIVLYAKGWYERSENICEDLDYFFSQIYGWTSAREDEVAHRMMIVLDRLYEAADVFSRTNRPYGWYISHASFEEEVRKRMSLYHDCSRDMDIIFTVLSVLQGLSKEEIELEPPFYGKHEHFRMGSLFGKNPISMTYKEMNRRAEQMFGRSSKKRENMWKKVLKR